MKKVFIVTIQIAIEATSESDAHDGIHAIMQDQDIVDWQYHSENGISQSAKLIGEIDFSTLKEGDVFKVAEINNSPVS
jgi:hypothetical protein